jgi:UTP--glucose-1-phosphate uridylyltransferase
MITKAVIPAAGIGTRLLPATKAQPKVMLPVLDAPAVQYVVQEAVDSGITDIVIVIGRDGPTIERHFARDGELEARLQGRGDSEALSSVRRIVERATISYVRQPEQRGLGDAVRCARSFVGEDPFAVLLGDTLIDALVPVTRQLIQVYEQEPAPIVGVETVAADKVRRYGIVEGTPLDDRRVRVDRMIEKPLPGETTSTMAIAGRYVLTPAVFDLLDNAEPGRNDEIQLTDALARMLPHTPIVAVPFEGRRYDIGDKLDYLRAILAFAQKRDEFSDVIRSFIKTIAASKDSE